MCQGRWLALSCLTGDYVGHQVLCQEVSALPYNVNNLKTLIKTTSTYNSASVNPERKRGTMDSCRSSMVVVLPIRGSNVTRRMEPVANASANTASPLGVRHDALVCGRPTTRNRSHESLC